MTRKEQVAAAVKRFVALGLDPRRFRASLAGDWSMPVEMIEEIIADVTGSTPAALKRQGMSVEEQANFDASRAAIRRAMDTEPKGEY